MNKLKFDELLHLFVVGKAGTGKSQYLKTLFAEKHQ